MRSSRRYPVGLDRSSPRRNIPQKITEETMIAPGTQAPEFTLDSHLGETVRSADLVGKKNQLLVFYPLDFTPT
jgi:hypothetical protein